MKRKKKYNNIVYLVINIIYCCLFYSKPPSCVFSINKGLGTMMQLDIVLNNKMMTIFGFGQNKKEAKVAAAKLALKNIKKMF